MKTRGYGAVSGGPVTTDDAYLRIAPHSRDLVREEVNRRAFRQTLDARAAVNAAREGKGTKVKPPKPRTFRMDPATVRRQHEKGRTIGWLARKYQVDYPLIEDAIRRAGGEVRTTAPAEPKRIAEYRQWRQRYEAGESTYTIAADIGMAPSSVAWAIKAAGGTIRTNTRGKPGDVDEHAVAADYLAGQTIEQIATRLHIGKGRIKTILDRHGVETRDRYAIGVRWSDPAFVADINRRLDTGQSQTSICRELHLSVEALRRHRKSREAS